MVDTLLILDQNGMREVKLLQYKKKGALLGRNSQTSDIVVNSPYISASHAQIIWDQNKIYLIDTGSKNGIHCDCSGHTRTLKPGVPFGIIGNQMVFWIGRKRSDADAAVLIFCEKSDGIWKSYQIRPQGTVIGRSEDCDICIDHVMVSRRHAVIKSEQGRAVLYDNRSKNGVFVNGMAVYEKQTLCENDLIIIAGTLLIYWNGDILYKNPIKGVDVEMNHVRKVVGREKVILDDVSCRIAGGEFVAIIGGSGAGKTTLMNAMSGFDSDVTGTVRVSGMDLHENFNQLKDMIGFVPQQDIIYENLVLRKMLYYTALMRMPEDTSKEEIDKRISQVLDMVDLKAHQNTYIRKLSGGQKKRASIAVELLADPKLFYLDEPTSGLDPGTEKNLMKTLHRLSAEQGKTIIMVTHTTQSLALCDKIIIMGNGGRLCYYGEPENAKEYFKVQDLVDIYPLVYDNAQHWEKLCKGTIQTVEEMTDMEMNVSREQKERLYKNRKVSAFRQFTVLVRRYLELIKNDRQRMALMFTQPIIIGLLLGVVAAENIFTVYENTKSILFALVCSGIWLGLFNTIQEVCKERGILKREYMGNLRLGAYLFSKYLVQAIFCLVQAVLLVWIFVMIVGKPQQGVLIASATLEMMLTLFLTIMSSATLGIAISAIAKNSDRAMAFAPFVLILQLLFSGILFKLEGFSNLISKVTISRWAIEAIGNTADLNGMDLKMQAQFPTLEHEAEALFEHSVGHLMQSWSVLLGFMILSFFISRVILTSLKRDRR